jgi:hypothetical protein
VVSRTGQQPGPPGLDCRLRKKSAGFAACAYLRSFGDTTRVHAKAEHVRDLHDRLSHAQDRLPLA